MQITAIYKYNIENEIVWSPNGCGLVQNGKWYKKCATMEVQCERMSESAFFDAIQSEEFRSAHEYDWRKDPKYAFLVKTAGVNND